MSAALLTRAAAEIQRKNNQIKASKAKEKQETSMLLAGAAGLAAAAGAGLVDAKWGSSSGPAKIKDTVPVNAVGAAVFLGACLIPGLPMKSAFAQVGAQLTGISIYRYEIDNVHFESA